MARISLGFLLVVGLAILGGASYFLMSRPGPVKSLLGPDDGDTYTVDVTDYARPKDDDTLLVLQETPDESLRGKVADAVHACPKRAISLEG